MKEQLAVVMVEYDCDSLSELISIALAIALNRDEAKLAHILVDQLED